MPGLQDVVFGGVQSPPSQVVVEISLDGVGGSETPDVDQLIEEVAGIMSGTTNLVLGQSYVDVAFGSEQPTENWIFIAATVFNGTDATPLNVWPGVITSKTKAGFRLQLNGTPDTGNYVLVWSIKGVFGYYLSGPSSGAINTPSSNFTVRLPDGAAMTGTVIITPHSIAGSFTPSTVSLSTSSPVATFTYTPATYGNITIGTTNNRGMDDPPQLNFIALVDTYTLDGPTDGDVGTPSTDFTVALPVGGIVAGTVTVTPDDSGDGGTFTPTSVELTTGSPSATFTYTAASVGTKTISTTNDGGLTDPASIDYAAVSNVHLLDTLISYWKLDEATGTRVDSHSTNDLSDTGSVLATTGVINAGAVFNGGNTLSRASNASLQVSSDFTWSFWARIDAQNVEFVIAKNDGVTNEYLIAYNGGGTGFQFFAGSAGAVEVGSLETIGVWVHVVAWYDSSDSKSRIRINDTTTYTGTAGSLNAPGAAGLAFSGNSIGTLLFMTGGLDEVGFWKRKLTALEITALYNSGSGLPYSSFTA